MKKKNGGKKHTHFKASFYWMFAMGFSVLFCILFAMAKMFPDKWKAAVIGGIACVLIVTGLISFRDLLFKKYRKNHKKDTAMKVINILIAIVMAVCSFLLPYYTSRVTDVIDNNNQVSSGMIKMNVYVMSDSYKQEHPDLFTGDETVNTSFSSETEELKSHKDDKLLTSLTVDGDYQKEALKKLESVAGSDFTLDDRNSIQEEAQALYQNEEKMMLMSESYASVLKDMDEYTDFDKDTRIIYTVEVPEKTSSIGLSNTDLTSRPFAVFIGGNDEEGELKLTGRTDVDMVVVVNPVTYQLGIFSYPRDSYVPNPALGNSYDKLTHLGLSGLDNTLSGIENLLEVDVDNYVLLNFTTFRKVIDAIGGVDVDNPYTFTVNDGRTFDEGRIHIDGDQALAFVRERYHLPDGDFGRNMHQQIVMKAIIEKITSPSMLVHFDSLITALKGTFLTNLSSDSIYSFMQYQLNNNISWNIVNYRCEGSMGMAICASAASQELSVVFPYSNQLEFMTEKADEIEDGKIVTQEDMPEGYGIKYEPVGGTGEVTEDYNESEMPEITPPSEQQIIIPDNSEVQLAVPDNTYTDPGQPADDSAVSPTPNSEPSAASTTVPEEPASPEPTPQS